MVWNNRHQLNFIHSNNDNNDCLKIKVRKKKCSAVLLIPKVNV